MMVTLTNQFDFEGLLNPWKNSSKNVQRSRCAILFIFILTIILYYQINSRHQSRQNYLNQRNKIKQCPEDSNGIAPYKLTKDQSVLYYNPNITFKKNQPYSTCH
ncbi:unnamed protein product [Adineta ricciae]|uniref:Uncharacterized protein n=1 Tax=Adineta ricciae TaxID=249248 RepID=A0A815QVF6_ADIRI|nr:unnamed protein product [Adineta ricciae]